MDEAPENVVFFNDYTAENYAASARAAAEPEITPKVQISSETALLASAYIINPNNVKLDGPDQYIQEHDFYENDEVLEALERQKELMLEGMYKEPAKILLLIRQLSMMFSSFPEWPSSLKPMDGTIESAKQEMGKMLSKLKDIFVDIEFLTKFKREDNLQTNGPLSRTPTKAFLEKPYATLMTDLIRGMVSQLVANTKMGGFGEKTEHGKSSSSAGPNNGLVASRLLMELPQPIVHELRVLLSTLKSDISPLIPMLLTNQEELQFILNIVRDREEEIAREIHERMQGERNRKKKEKREKYLRSAQAYKSLTQGKADTKLYGSEWDAQWSRQKVESKEENRHSQAKESEPNEWNREGLGKRAPVDWNSTSKSANTWSNPAPPPRSNSPKLQHQEMKKNEGDVVPQAETAQEKSPLEFQLSILSLCQKASSLVPETNGLSTVVEEQNYGMGEGWDLADAYGSTVPALEFGSEIPKEKKEPEDPHSTIQPEERPPAIEPEPPVLQQLQIQAGSNHEIATDEQVTAPLVEHYSLSKPAPEQESVPDTEIKDTMETITDPSASVAITEEPAPQPEETPVIPFAVDLPAVPVETLPEPEPVPNHEPEVQNTQIEATEPVLEETTEVPVTTTQDEETPHEQVIPEQPAETNPEKGTPTS